MTAAMCDPPEYEVPQPGERDSLRMLTDRIEGAVVAIREEVPLFLAMDASVEGSVWLLDLLSHTRQGLQQLELDAEHQMHGILG